MNATDPTPATPPGPPAEPVNAAINLPTQAMSMMPGKLAAAKAPAPVVLIDPETGASYPVPPISEPPDSLLHAVGQHLLSLQPSPVAVLLAAERELKSHPELLQAYAREAYQDAKTRRPPPPEVCVAWLDSSDARAWIAWRALSRQHKHLTLAKVSEMLEAFITQATAAKEIKQ